MPNAPAHTPYFLEPSTTERLTRLAALDRLTVVAGAGWSADWGLPHWRTLIIRLLEKHVAPRFHVSDETRARAFASEILQAHDLIGAASIIRESLGDHFEHALQQELYRNRVGDFGSAGIAVANLFYTWNANSRGHLTIITTNYDLSFETALMHEVFAPLRKAQRLGKATTVATAKQAKPFLAGERQGLPVYHIHGVLPIVGTTKGELVFSEEDYASVVEKGEWQRELFDRFLGRETGACLFIGMSLTDPNVLRHLLRAGGSGKTGERIIFLPAQAEGYIPDLGPGVERAIRSRLARFGVEKESPDYFSQVPQFLNELAVCRAAEGAHRLVGRRRTLSQDSVLTYDQYGDRLARWRNAMQADPARLSLQNDEVFAQIQHDNHYVLRRTRTLIYHMVRGVRQSRPITERFAVQLWARNPHRGELSLEMWGSSEKAWLERETILRARITRESAYNAVRAFCAGGTLVEPTKKEGSRCAMSLASVIYLAGHWQRLPVGVIVLETDFPEQESCLNALAAESRQQLIQLLLHVGRVLLTPQLELSTLLTTAPYESASALTHPT
jgi:hypothetical protein